MLNVLPFPIIINRQVVICNSTQTVLIIATLSAFLLSSYAFVPMALHQYCHIVILYIVFFLSCTSALRDLDSLPRSPSAFLALAAAAFTPFSSNVSASFKYVLNACTISSCSVVLLSFGYCF